MDPFYKVMKMHDGVDFSAPPIGTKIYATGDGTVSFTEKGKKTFTVTTYILTTVSDTGVFMLIAKILK